MRRNLRITDKIFTLLSTEMVGYNSINEETNSELYDKNVVCLSCDTYVTKKVAMKSMMQFS